MNTRASPALAMHRAALRHPWAARQGARGLLAYLAWLLVLVAGTVAVANLMRVGPLAQGAAAGLVALGWLWCQQVAGLLAQNHPHLARLLPGQLRTLRASLLLQALVIGAAAFGLFALLVGPGLKWLWLVAIVLLLLAWLVRQPLLWLAVCLLPMLPTVLTQWHVSGLPAHAAALPWVAQAALLAGGAVLLLAVLGGGGLRHGRSFARQQRWLAFGSARVPVARKGLWRRLLWPLVWPNELYRGRLLAGPTPGNAVARLNLGLGTGGQWPALVWGALLLTALMAGLMLVSTHLGRGPGARTGLQVGLAMALFNGLAGVQSERLLALWRRRREQALLVLLPGVPTGADLLARLEAGWRREHLALWLLGTALWLAFAAVAGGWLPPFAAALAAASLPLPWLQGHRRLVRDPRSGGRFWLGTLPPLLVLAVAVQVMAVPPWASLALGVVVYLLCAWWVRPPGRALLPIGRTTGGTVGR
ncbi:hypothetical protein [Pseudorhodoferax sp.]|uniref:hypothetical protein n=1 Tax=Pseudorhodoferax sp. TaxID=1993553 RepID=UPI002DD66EFB|nr:hypothetical protein [Pseudorhodoferax sp.]